MFLTRECKDDSTAFWAPHNTRGIGERRSHCSHYQSDNDSEGETELLLLNEG